MARRIVDANVQVVSGENVPDTAFIPIGAIRDSWVCKKNFVIYGAAGTGKTFASLYRLVHYGTKYKGSRILLARKTRSSMTQTVLATWENDVLKPGHPSLLGGGDKQNRASYILPGGTEVVIGGLDNLDRIMSANYDYIYVPEALEITTDDYQKLNTRLRNARMPFQQMVMDCNPGPPSHWIKRYMDENRLLGFKSVHKDNPALWDSRLQVWTKRGEDYLGRLRGVLTGVQYKRLFEGEWATAEGLVYPELVERAVVTPTPAVVPVPAIRVVGAIDWGFSPDPVVVLVGVLCQDGTLRIVEEIYQTKMSHDELAYRVRELEIKWNVSEWTCDPSRNDLVDMMRRRDVSARGHKVRQVSTGLAMVESRIMRKLIEIWDCCPKTIIEAGQYERKKLMDGTYSDEPMDCSNHAMDALRYMVCAFDYGSLIEPVKPIVADSNANIRLNIESAKIDKQAEADRIREEQRLKRWKFSFPPMD